MAPKQMRRISDIAPREEVLPQLHKLEEVLNREMVLTKFEYRDGENGEYAVFDLQDATTGETASYSCGGQAIMRQFALMKSDDLPCLVTPVKSGRVYLFV